MPTLPDQLYDISTHPGIRDKPTWREEYATNWQQHTVTTDGLLHVIRSGTGWIAAAMSSARRSSAAFKHADLAVVDVDYGMDIDDFLSKDLAASALLYYTTGRHHSDPGRHRFRIVFRLPRRIDDPDLYKAVVTYLIQALGSDRSCSDPCRIFYSYSKGQVHLLHPEATLPESILTAAQAKLEEDLKRRREAPAQIDPITLAQAEWVLDHVLEPTADGERDVFIRITAAAASAGDALYAPWSDWASRGHHGKGRNRKQTTERFFRGFSGNSTLATLFYLAKDQRPDWRKGLPDHIRGGRSSTGIPGVAGYDHEDFLREDDFEPAEASSTSPATPSILKWAGSSPEPVASDGPGGNHADDGSEAEYIDNDFETEYIETGSDVPVQPPGRKRGRPQGSKNKSIGPADEVVDRIRSAFPNLRLNLLTRVIEYDGKEGLAELADPTTAYLRISRGRKTDVFPKTLVTDAIHIESEHNQYNPVISYLERCSTQPPVPYWETIAEELFGLSPDPIDCPRLNDGRLLANVILQRFLIGAVARTMEPGCRHDWMLILIGSQNKGKSFFFQYLTPPDLLNRYPWCATIQQGISYIKDRPHVLHAGWIVLLDECDRFFQRRYVEELKNLISVPTDRSAPKYRNEQNYPRSFVLAGNTNNDTFMLDPTGNRRFMPIRVFGKVTAPGGDRSLIIDLDRVKQDRDAIWSAARQAYLDGETHDFSSDEIAQIEEYISSFMLDDPMIEAVANVLKLHPSFFWMGSPAFLMHDICSKLDISERDFSAVRQPLSDALQRLGLISVRRRVAAGERAKRFWVYDTSELSGDPIRMEGDLPAGW